MAAEDFIITRKRKKYRFARFAEFSNCYEADEWLKQVNRKADVIEIGAGTALFLVEQAKLDPKKQFVAVDVKADRMQKGADRALAEGITNICFVRSDIRNLSELFKPGSATELWLTFSDPYPKKRHTKHRLTHPSFLAIYKEILSKNGSLFFKTDNEPLFKWSLEQLVAYGATLKELSFDLHNSELPDKYKIMTTYEQKFVGAGLPIYFVSASF